MKELNVVVVKLVLLFTMVYISLRVKYTRAVNSSSFSKFIHLSRIASGSDLRIDARSRSENFFFLTIV